MHCLRLYKKGNALPPTGVIDLKLCFKSIAFGYITERILFYVLCKEGDAKLGWFKK